MTLVHERANGRDRDVGSIGPRGEANAIARAACASQSDASADISRIPLHSRLGLRGTMIDLRQALVLALVLSSCAQAQPLNEVGASANLRVSISASNDSNWPQELWLSFENHEEFPVCFEAGDLRPGYGSTEIRRPDGTILNGQVDLALELLKGVNLSGGLVVVRPRQRHGESIQLSEYSADRGALVVHIEIGAFRCNDLFDDSTREVNRTRIKRLFRFSDGRPVN